MKTVSEQTRQYIATHTTLTLATASAGQPWATSLFYVSDNDLRLYFVSDSSTRHVRQGMDNQNVAATITEHEQAWQMIQGVQVEGRLEQVSGADRPEIELLYGKKFPFIMELLNADTDDDEQHVREEFQTSQFYVLIPSFIRFINNTRGFGFKEEFKIDDI